MSIAVAPTEEYGGKILPRRTQMKEGYFIIINYSIKLKQKQNLLSSVRERTIPTERPLLVDEI
jgi:hypothetical protein